MANRQEWTVRVVNYTPYNEARPVGSLRANHLSGTWIEQLRYMGHCREIKPYDGEHKPTEQTEEEKAAGKQRYYDSPTPIIEFYAPKGVLSKVWAEQNAARMRSFGINAVPAPKWVG